jgi:hypothetical protein
VCFLSFNFKSKFYSSPGRAADSFLTYGKEQYIIVEVLL